MPARSSPASIWQPRRSGRASPGLASSTVTTACACIARTPVSVPISTPRGTRSLPTAAFPTSWWKPPAYGASKAAVLNLTKYLAAFWGPRGVRVNALSPGGVLGGQDDEFIRKLCDKIPLRRMAVASDLVGPLVFLASDASAYVTGI